MPEENEVQETETAEVVEETQEVDPTEEDAGGDETETATDEGEEFDSARALAKIRKLNSENKNLRDAKKAAEQEAETAKGDAGKIPALEAENLRLRVAIENGLPVELASRLQGATEEEVLADAEKLLEFISPKGGPSNKPNLKLQGGGSPAQEPEEVDPRKLAEHIPRR